MSGSDDRIIDKAAFFNELAALEDGSLDPDRIEAMGRLLDESPTARRLYLGYFDDSAMLREIAHTLEEQGRMPVIGNALQIRRMLHRSVMAAAALVVLLAALATFFKIRMPEPMIVSSAAVAGTSWTLDGQPQGATEKMMEVHPGGVLQVKSGTVRLTNDSGGTLLIQGPAVVAFPELHRPELRSGWLWIDTGEGDDAFAVTTPRHVVRDIGTRFGMRVPEDDGPLEVHLIDGRVEVRETKDGERNIVLAEGGTAKAFDPAREVDAPALAHDPFPALPDLLNTEPGYRTTLLGQSPVGYWSLDGASLESLVNMIPGGSNGAAGQAVRLGDPGVGTNGIFPGLPDDNRSHFLDGSSDQSVIIGIDGPRGVLRREGAVSFWIRRDPSAEARDEILWLAGISSTFNVPPRAMMHARLSHTGKVGFHVADGESEIRLTSKSGVTDGEWHHVVASWGPVSINLYLDGELEMTSETPRDLVEGGFHGRSVRFGKPSWDLRQSTHSFTGWVDEIALWNRPLTHTEVKRQYESAAGEAE